MLEWRRWKCPSPDGCRDFQYAARSLRRSRISTAAAFVVLAVGIGAAAGIFTLMDRLLYRPLPVAEPDELVTITESYVTADGNRVEDDASLSYAGYVRLRDNVDSFSGVIGKSSTVLRERATDGPVGSQARASQVSGNFFTVLGVPPSRGRVLLPSDDSETADSRVAVLSHRFWTSRYDRRPSAIGSTIYLRDRPFTIVGVLPESFRGVQKGSEPELYVPLSNYVEFFGREALNQSRNLQVMARLQPGTARSDAQNELAAVWPSLVPTEVFASFPDNRRPDPRTSRIQLADGAAGYMALEGEQKDSLLLLAAIVGMIVLVALMNVACLLLSRNVSRRNETAIRFALGAGGFRILRQILIENFLLTVSGAVAGVWLAGFVQRIVLAVLQWGDDRPIDLALDGRVVAFTAGAAVLTGLLCSLVSGRQAFQPMGKQVAFSAIGGGSLPRFTAGKGLIVMEVALSLVIVSGALMFLEGFRNIRSIPLGFDAEGVVVVEVGLDGSRLEDAEADRDAALMRASHELVETLRGLQEVESVGFGDSLPFFSGFAGYLVTALDPDSGSDARPHPSTVVRVDAGYFDGLGMAIREGRAVGPADGGGAPRVGVLGEGLAATLFGDRFPIGQFIRIADLDVEVVGVVEDARFQNVKRLPPDILYLSVLQASPGGTGTASSKIHARTSMAPSALSSLVGQHIRAAGLPLEVRNETALESAVGASYSDDRIRMQASTLLGLVVALLVAVGIYGLMVYSVERRSREIAVRIALGGTTVRVMLLVLRDSFWLLLLGMSIGLPVSLWIMTLLSEIAFGLSPVEPLLLVGAVFLIAVTVLLSAAGPAFTAARIDPMRVFRME